MSAWKTVATVAAAIGGAAAVTYVGRIAFEQQREQTASAHNKVRTMFWSPDRHEPDFHFRGHPVYVSDALTSAHSGMMHNPAAFTTKVGDSEKFIVINTKVVELGEAHMNAILAHEAGHIELGHVDYYHRCHAEGKPYGRNDLHECEADLFAQNLGYDMVGALKKINTILINGFEIRRRVKYLKAMAKAK